MRIKICRKEAKETILWLKLLDTEDGKIGSEINDLLQESTELMKIFGSILIKSQ